MPTPLLLIHGMFASARDMDRLREGFARRGFDAFAPDLRGHGPHVPAGAVAGLSLGDYVDALLDDVARRGWEAPPVVLGHSMGGLIAQLLAQRLRCRALVLLAPAPAAGQWFNPLPALRMYAPMLRLGAFWRKAYRPPFDAFCRVALPGIPPERHREIYQRLGEDSGRAIAEIAFWSLDPRRAAHVDPARIAAPVYLVSGGLDRLVPALSVRRTAARFAGATLRHWPDRGHILIDDRHTEAMADEIVAWLAALPRGDGA